MVNNYFKRRHEIAKKRLEYRLEALHSFIPVYLSLSKSSSPFIDDPELNKKFNDASINFQLYGFEDEIDLLTSCQDSIMSNNGKKATDALNKLIELVKYRIRDELKLPKLK
ncbi:MAG: hypothetical protein FAF03_10495 [Epsilonproteobacteria bacterium]|nr:hypothetical protein [Campylobacterota bacterium]